MIFLTGDSIQKIRARDFGAANFGLVSLHITFWILLAGTVCQLFQILIYVAREESEGFQLTYMYWLWENFIIPFINSGFIIYFSTIQIFLCKKNVQYISWFSWFLLVISGSLLNWIKEPVVSQIPLSVSLLLWLIVNCVYFK